MSALLTIAVVIAMVVSAVFTVLSKVARATKDVRVIQNKIVTWRGIEYRNGNKGKP
jgi:hypothetical protein